MNAKTEFLEEIDGSQLKLKCALLKLEEGWKEYKNFVLPVGYTDKQLKDFLESIDFEYDDGYGSQELYGNIWFEDGTWAERYEYDGSEYWTIKSCPEIPTELTDMQPSDLAKTTEAANAPTPSPTNRKGEEDESG